MTEVSGKIVVKNAVTIRVIKVNRLAGTVTLGITTGNAREVVRDYRPGDRNCSTLEITV